MNKQARRADQHLKSVVPPVFENATHKELLRIRLQNEQADAVQKSFRKRSRSSAHLLWGAGAIAATLVVGLIVGRSVLAPKSVRAEVLVALDNVHSFVVNETVYRETTAGAEPVEIQTIHFREGIGMAIASPRQQGWNVDGNLYHYDVQRNQVAVTRGIGLLPIKASFSQYRLIAGYGEERDQGLVSIDGQMLRLVEMLDDNDPTQRLEIYADPESMLPVEMLTYQRNDANEPWRLARRSTVEYNVEFDSDVFTPTYPEDAEVIEKDIQSAEQADGSTIDGASLDDWPERAVAIEYVGDKYLAVEGVWNSPSGWIGIKFRTNLRVPFVIPMGFSKDTLNQERWHADAFTLHNLLGGTMVTTGGGERFLSHNGASETTYPDGSTGHVFFYQQLWGEFHIDPVHIDTLTFRTLLVPRDRGRGESTDHYWGWKENPDQWQLIELIVPVPEPSEDAPACFNDKDLAWLQRTGVEQSARQNWLDTMRRKDRHAEAYTVVSREPKDDQRLYGFEWVMCLKELGKQNEAYVLYADAPQDVKLGLGLTWMYILVDLGKKEEAEAFLAAYQDFAAQNPERISESMVDSLETYAKRPSH
jgi:hypothetical protein